MRRDRESKEKEMERKEKEMEEKEKENGLNETTAIKVERWKNMKTLGRGGEVGWRKVRGKEEGEGGGDEQARRGGWRHGEKGERERWRRRREREPRKRTKEGGERWGESKRIAPPPPAIQKVVKCRPRKEQSTQCSRFVGDP